jgi:hypothetical protein
MSTARNGHYKLTVYLRPDQYLWMHAVALDDVMERGGGRPDVSKMLRDMIDDYRPSVDKALADRKKKRK